MALLKRFTGHCPELEKQNTIILQYEEVNFCGDNKTYYTCVCYRCDYQAFNDCSQETCPIFEKAPKDF